MAGKKRRMKIAAFISLLVLLSSLYKNQDISITLGSTGTADKNLNEVRFQTIELMSAKADRGVSIENENFIMTVDEETLAVTITNRHTNEVFNSSWEDENSNSMWKGFCASGIVVEFYKENSVVSERADMTDKETVKDIVWSNKGFEANINMKRYGFSFTVEVELLNDGFTVSVKEESIIEGDTYKAGAIYLYPMFGSTLAGEINGYMFIPEGAGALIELKDNNKKYKSPYAKRIYGDNAGVDKFIRYTWGTPSVVEEKKITMPVFGMVYTDKRSGFLGIVEEGEYNAEILAYPNGVMTDYNFITARFNIREIYTMQTAKTSGVPAYEKTPYFRDLRIRYIFTDGDNADYSGLARLYQKYLLEKGVLSEKQDEYRMRLDFFGADTKKWFVFDSVVPVTTINDISEIISDMQENNVGDIISIYTAWQKGGYSLSRGSLSMKVDSKLGSKNKLISLAEKLDSRGVIFALEQDLLYASTSASYNTKKDIIKGINQVLIEKPLYGNGAASMYYMSPNRTEQMIKSFVAAYPADKVSHVALMNLPSTLYSYYLNGKISSRGDAASQIKGAVEAFSSHELIMDNPNQYLWSNTSAYINMPLSTSNFNYISKEVPFLAIVLKGYIPYWGEYINFKANEKEYLLKMLEYGAYPSFLLTKESPVLLKNTSSSYIYSSEYDILKDRIISYEEELSKVFNILSGAKILNHKELQEDIIQVSYDNGYVLNINYTKYMYVSGSIKIPAQSYLLVNLLEEGDGQR